VRRWYLQSSSVGVLSFLDRHAFVPIHGKTWRVSSTLENTFVQAYCSFPATAFAKAVATLRYVKNAHSVRKRLLRPIGIDGWERKCERERERERKRAGAGGRRVRAEIQKGDRNTVVRKTARWNDDVRYTWPETGRRDEEGERSSLGSLLGSRALWRAVSTARSIAPLTATPLSG